MRWNSEERAFSIEAYFSNGRSVIATQRAFRNRSPDLTACNFFLWFFFKSRVYVNRPRTLEDLEANIRAEIANIPAAVLVKVMAKLEIGLFSVSTMGGVTYVT